MDSDYLKCIRDYIACENGKCTSVSAEYMLCQAMIAYISFLSIKVHLRKGQTVRRTRCSHTQFSSMLESIKI